MRPSTILSALLAVAASAASASDSDELPGRIASVFIQPLDTSTPPTLLAEIRYDISSQAAADNTQSEQQALSKVISYEAPDLPEDAKLVRVGVYDAATQSWVSSTSVASVENFGKGYSPHFVLTVADSDELLGVGVKGVRIDAGQTRDFGPQVVLHRAQRGAQPLLGKPVVLSPEGKKVVVEEKSFLQKYWWALAIGAVLMLGGGGGDGK